MTPPFVRACAREGDDPQAVELLLGQGHAGGLEERAPDGGLTALMAACKQGNLSCVERLLHAGAHSDAVDDKGFTPLLWACRYKHAACVELLLRAKTALDLSPPSGKTASGVTSWL